MGGAKFAVKKWGRMGILRTNLFLSADSGFYQRSVPLRVVPPGHPHRGGLAVGLPSRFFIWVILRHPSLTPGVPRFNHAGLALFKKIDFQVLELGVAHRQLTED